MSDGPPLYCSQPTGEKTHTNQQCERLAKIRQTLTVLADRRRLGSQCCLSTGLVANGIRPTKRCNALSLRSDVTRGLPDLGKSFTLLVCVRFLTSRFYIDYIKINFPLKRCAHTGVTIMFNID
jgi:hypothetical protein